MRTTVTLDDDVAAKLRQVTRQKGISFKEALNASVRRGLEAGGSAPQPYRVKPRSLRAKPGLNLDRALDIAARMEDEETLRKLALRK
jgi:hypothetical protein